jgi:predicted RND superfamily exporter protein
MSATPIDLMHNQSPSSLVGFSLRHPKWVLALTLLLTMLFAVAFRWTTIDTNPKNMLPPTSDVRVWNDAVDKQFGLHEDNIVAAITPAGGVLTPDSLAKLKAATADILKLEGIVGHDVNGLYTIDNITADGDSLRIAPLMNGEPDAAALAALRRTLFDGTLFVDRIISRDEQTTAIYIPLAKGADGAQVADAVQAVLQRHFPPQEIKLAGDPIARDRFGGDMFKLMGMFAPVAGMLMMGLIYYMFGSMWFAGIMMLTAMVSIVCAMGLAIFLGYPVHIMSSMAPVFLMAIATDSIHIFNEFSFRARSVADRKEAIAQTMRAVARPVQYTALATAAGFAVLLFMEIVPVKVFGGIVLFGTVVLRILSFTLIPALLAIVPLPSQLGAGTPTAGAAFWDRQLARMAGWALSHTRSVMLATLGLAIAAAFGVSRIVVNNNMIHWFKADAEVRVADRAINEQLGGTSLAYLVVDTGRPDGAKDPHIMAFVDRLQADLQQAGLVGKTFSVADYVKRMNRVMHGDDPAWEKVPDDADLIGQYLMAFSMGAKPSDLNRVVDYPYQRLNVWLQLKTWDAQAMDAVIQRVNQFAREQGVKADIKPAGTAYFNLVWNQEVLKDMIKGFLIALAIVFLILVLDFRSLKWAMLAYLPLLLTVLLIFGAIGWIGKDFDMPVAVLSCLSLGMAVDFAIHFVSRFRQHCREVQLNGDGQDEALRWTITRPGKGIMRNALLFSIAFSVMILAPLTPYVTVGVFILAMMLLSAFATLTLLPALIRTLGLKGN